MSEIKDTHIDDLVKQMEARRQYHLKTAQKLGEAIEALRPPMEKWEEEIFEELEHGKGKYRPVAAKVFEMIKARGPMTMDEILSRVPKNGKRVSRGGLTACLNKHYLRRGLLKARGKRSTRTYFV